MTITVSIRRFLLAGVAGLIMTVLGAGPATASNLVPAADGFHVQGYTLPGISDAGWANFENNVTVRVINQGSHGAMLIARGGAGKRNFFNLDPDTSYPIRGGSYLLRATFDASDNLTGGSVRITGSIDTEYGRASGVLMTARLGDPHGGDGTDWNYNSDLIGFDTHNIVCHAVLASFSCHSDAESAYLSLDAGGFSGLENYTSTGLAVTTVPVPAAAWLFGSGLLGLLGAARREPVGQ
ncbi:MAG: hypothetical protein PVJ66_07830 [Gammaproteobacteria bacterium]|jgi:hypothetical protein